MDTFAVTPAVLSEVAAQLRTRSQSIHAALTDLEAEATRLSGQWDGAAREAYQRAQAAWSAAFTDMKAVLDKIAAGSDSIAAHYAESDAGLAKLFGAQG